MNKKEIFYIIFMISVLISSISQILLKKSAMHKYETKIKEYLNPLVITAYGMFFISTFITMYAFRYVPLSMGPILESMGYVFVAILGMVFLHERLGRKKILGMGIILIGIIFFSL